MYVPLVNRPSYRSSYSYSSSLPSGIENSERRGFHVPYVPLPSVPLGEIDEFDEDEEIDNVPTSDYGRFTCGGCGNRYSTEVQLGTHFMITHRDYTSFLVLDSKKNNDGFPGFRMLETINMIYVLRGKILNSIVKNNNFCDICCERFREPVNERNDCCKTKSDNKKCENFIDFIEKSKKVKTSFFDDQQLMYGNLEIRQTELVSFISKIENGDRNPVELQCCNKLICKKCLELTFKESQKITCPFCTRDHTNSDIKFFIEYYVSCDKTKWEKWWKCHQEIFF